MHCRWPFAVAVIAPMLLATAARVPGAVKPYHIPLAAFIARSGPPNVLPAAKNIGGTRLAMAAVRMHPTEWACGEVAGHLAAFCIKKGVDPAAVRANRALLTAFQQQLVAAGVPIRWSTIIPRIAPRHLAPLEEDFVVSEGGRVFAR
jgi:hypothetical protein